VNNKLTVLAADDELTIVLVEPELADMPNSGSRAGQPPRDHEAGEHYWAENDQHDADEASERCQPSLAAEQESDLCVECVVTMGDGHQSRLPALIAASAMWASENNRTMMLATSGNRRGCRTVALAGQ
jgi:hypothetical protein